MDVLQNKQQQQLKKNQMCKNKNSKKILAQI